MDVIFAGKSLLFYAMDAIFGAGGAAICICGAGCGGSEACNGLNLLKAALRGDAALRAATLRVFGWDLC